MPRKGHPRSAHRGAIREKVLKGARAPIGVEGTVPLLLGSPRRHRLDLAGHQAAEMTQNVAVVKVPAVEFDLAITDPLLRR